MTFDIRQWLLTLKRDIWDELRWSYAPPLLVYFAAGLSGLTAVSTTFVVKDYLGLSAAFMASLGFWAGLPWALKMPIGHLVDIIWRFKSLLIFLGAALLAAANLIMYGVITAPGAMRAVMPAESWFVIAMLLTPVGLVVQDVVADAMTVEAVPTTDAAGKPLAEAEIKSQHTTMQTLGRFAIISGLVVVAALNIFMFAGVDSMDQAAQARIYSILYLTALAIPLISITGVLLGAYMKHIRRQEMLAGGVPRDRIEQLLRDTQSETKPDWWIFGGAAAFVAFTLTMGLTRIPFNQEIIFAGSVAIILFLMSRLLRELEPAKAQMLIGTAAIIFVFRAMPLPGDGQTWFSIDVLKFDQQFLAVLSLIASVLTLVGIIMLKPLMASRSMADLVVILSIAGAILTLPSVGLYYGLHEWTKSWSGGVIDQRFITVVNTMVESPLGQIAMIPMLAWIAKNAPNHLKATFFAVMASFSNLALSASALGTRYLNEIFIVSREVRNRESGAIEVAANYSQLGHLLITVTVLAVALPLLTVYFVQRTKFRTTE